MKNAVFLAMLKSAVGKKTLYVLGAFGAPATDKNKKRYSASPAYNAGRASMIYNATPDTFFFDCSGLVKGIAWGWNADKGDTYGGATYKTNGVDDMGTAGLIDSCKDATTDFSKIEPGELLWMEGHCGVYMGDGLCIEASPKWGNGVQWTAVANLGNKAGYNARTWTKHGHLPFIDYSAPQKFNVGQTVDFKGGQYFGSPDGSFGWNAPAGSVAILGYSSGNRHPYHIMGVVDGYVDESALASNPAASYTDPKMTMAAELPVLTKGTKGEAVKTLKAILKAHGFNLNESNYFDNATDAAVREMQKATGITVDGSVGRQTWEMLISG